MSTLTTPLDSERFHACHGGIPPAIDRERMRRAAHEAGHCVAAVAYGHQVHQAVIGGDYPRTEFATPLPVLIDAPVTYAGIWAEARHLSRQPQPRPEHLRAALDLNVLDRRALVAATGPDAGREVIPLLVRCAPALAAVAGQLYLTGHAGHRAVCAALGLSDQGGPGSVELAAIRSGLRAVRPRPLNTTRRG